MPIKLKLPNSGIKEKQLSNIKNIIFDLGGVIINVDFELSINSFKDLGFTNFNDSFTQIKQTSLFELFETGKIPSQTFRNELRKFKIHLLDNEIDTAWNAMIGPLPLENFELICELKKNYRTFLLSNTNLIHMDFFYDYLTKNFGENTFEKMFDQSYLSYEIGYRKPDKEAFRYVLDNAGLNPSETVFIDDLSTNVEAASKLGIVAYQFHDERLVDLFERR